jgi:hypothetical protein
MTTKKEVKQHNKKVVEAKRIPELSQQEAMYFKELVDASNKYTGLRKQKAQYEFAIKKMQENRNKIQTGEIKMPINLWLIPNVMSYPEYDKKVILKMFDEQIETYQTTVKSLVGMIEHNYDEYMESAARNREFLARRFATVTAKAIVPERKVIKDEENLFEAEFKDLVNNPEKQKELRDAQKEAVKRNLARKIKGK